METELWQYNHYIWCDAYATTQFQKTKSHGGMIITSGVAEMASLNSEEQVSHQATVSSIAEIPSG
jgi:hypothetical protein